MCGNPLILSRLSDKKLKIHRRHDNIKPFAYDFQGIEANWKYIWMSKRL